MRELVDWVRKRDSSGNRKKVWACVAIGIFSISAASISAPVWSRDIGDTVAYTATDHPGVEVTRTADVKFEAWLVARNARTLLTSPQQLFDTEHCAPLVKSMTLGIPMITMGLLGIPGYLASGNPVVAYNSALFLWLLFAATAMYLLVLDWTGVPAAAIAAGLLYAFHATRLGLISHPSVVDTTWIVFALFFARRMFADGRWRDAIGLAVACALQVAADFYPLLAAVFLTPPFAVWLIACYGLTRRRFLQLGAVFLFISLAAWLTLGPYLEAREATDTLRRDVQYFMAWSEYAPGQIFFPGWLAIGLSSLGLAVGRHRIMRDLGGDPRWPLLVGAILVIVMASGPYTGFLLHRLGPSDFPILPNLYSVLASQLPGLDSIRDIRRLAAGAHIVFSVFAGMGVAALVRFFPRRSILVSTALLALVTVVSIWPAVLGAERPYRWSTTEIGSSASAISFFERLEEMGNRGPILELPFDHGIGLIMLAPTRIMLSFHHRRRTSACYGSYFPDREKLREAANRFPEAGAIEALRGLGFTTVILHHAPTSFLSRAYTRRIDLSARKVANIERLLATDSMTAYAMRSAMAPAE